MEPITLCGAVIVLFGLWVDVEPRVRAVAREICKSKLFTVVIPQPTVQRPVFVRRMPICLAKPFNY